MTDNQRPLLSTSIEDRVIVMTLDRPEKLNAWNYRLHAELRCAIEAANLDDDIDAIVLTATGKAFCAGADMSEVFELSEDEKRQARANAQTHTWLQLMRQTKPIIAAVNGAAIGIGVTLILPMDQIIAASGAKFALSFVKMGIVPELAGSSVIQRRIGPGSASRLLLTGDPVSAEEALAIGLIDKVVPPDDLLVEATTLARRMGRNPRAALLATKELLADHACETDLGKVQQREVDALARCYASEEHKEAVAAFFAKRSPDFKAARQRQ